MIHQSWKLSHYRPFSLMGTCVLVGFVLAIPAQGATYYVATAGSDSHPGTVNQPFKTFKKGVSVLQPGDTLYIRGGLYTEQIDLQTPDKTGTAGNYITIGGYQGETVILQFADTASLGYGPIKARGNRGYFIFENIILDGSASSDTGRSGWAIRDGNHHFILHNLEIKNFKNVSAVFVSANDVTIKNCRLHDQISKTGAPGTRHYGVYYHDGTKGVIEGNDIYNNAGGGLNIYPGPINDLIIRNNKIHDNNTWPDIAVGGIVVSTTSSPASMSKIRIYNNIIYNNGSSPTAGSATGIRIEGLLTIDTKVWNNTVYNNKGYGISMNQSVNTAVQNNVMFGNLRGEIADYGISSLINHNLTADPTFVKPEAFDFRLQPKSLAIDRGATLVDVATDFKEIPRPVGAAHDIGAYEWDGSDIKPINTPQDLSIQ